MAIPLRKWIAFIENGRRWKEVAISIAHEGMPISNVRALSYTPTPKLFNSTFFHS